MKQWKILILESNQQFGKELEAALSAGGYTVCGRTDDGEEGIALIERYQPDLVVMNVLLKNLDGFAVMSAAKERGDRCRFVALGNFCDDKTIDRILRSGASYYMMKPVSPSVVCGQIEGLTTETEATMSHNAAEKKRNISLDERISNIFISIGIPPHIKGYSYLREGIKFAVEEPSIINNVTKGLYPRIGEKFETSASKVERAIRHAIEVAWNRGRTDAINAIFGARVYIGNEKPTNSEFIALVADKLLLESMV